MGLALLVLATSGCAVLGTSSNDETEAERSLKEADPAVVAAARERVYRDLTQGLSTYRLAPGDTIEVIYLGSNLPSFNEYTIGVGDRLLVELHYIERPPTTAIVRPDGRITLPLKGDIMAAGRTPMQLGQDIQRAYSDIYRDPIVSVSVEQFTSKLDDLRVSLSNIQRGRSQRVLITPDGMAYLPYLKGVRVAGTTVDETRERINEEYRKFGNLEVAVLLEAVTGNRVFVFGEVARPGAVTVTGPMTVVQALASAGGHLPTASVTDVKVLYWSAEDKQARVRTIDLKRVFSGQHIDEDMVLPGNSTVYVPPTGVVATGRFMDQLLRGVFMFNGVSVGFTKDIGGDSQ